MASRAVNQITSSTAPTNLEVDDSLEFIEMTEEDGPFVRQMHDVENLEDFLF